MARRTRSRFIRPAPKSKIWLGNGINTVTLAPGPVLVSTLNAAALALRPFTILRTRMLIIVSTDQTIASEGNSGVYSRQVVTESAAAAGIGSVPTPITETEADYFVYQPFAFDFLFFDATGVNLSTNQYVIDSKAMRKVGFDDQVIGVAELQVSNGALLSIQGRTLIQLH